MQLKIKKLHKEVPTPQYKTDGAACFDLHAWMPEELQDVAGPGDSRVIATGLVFEIEPGYCLKVYSRSGHGINYGVSLANGTGIIDSDYRGELLICLRNHGLYPFHINHLDRIAQAMIVHAPQVQIVEVDELSDTERGAGGFGSTGV